MTDTFETTLAGIVSQKSDFESRDEHAVEMFVVLPLLGQVGWNTGNVSEIYPQRRLADRSRVDFDLQIDGESRIVIEVKWWGHALDDEDEDQLVRYSQLAKPKLAVLTSGRNWRFYLPPKSKSAPLREFLDFDITKVQSTEVARRFKTFLARESMVDFGTTVREAGKLYTELQAYQSFRKKFTEAWNGLAADREMLTDLALGFSEKEGISANRDNVVRFLESHSPLVNEATTGDDKSRKKPASYALFAYPNGKKKMTHTLGKAKGWNNFLLELCELMQSRHPEIFRQNLLSMTDWFAASKDSKFEAQVGPEEVYAKWGGAGEVRDACYEIVAKFGYPRDSLVIKDSKGAVL